MATLAEQLAAQAANASKKNDKGNKKGGLAAQAAAGNKPDAKAQQEARAAAFADAQNDLAADAVMKIGELAQGNRRAQADLISRIVRNGEKLAIFEVSPRQEEGRHGEGLKWVGDTTIDGVGETVGFTSHIILFDLVAGKKVWCCLVQDKKRKDSYSAFPLGLCEVSLINNWNGNRSKEDPTITVITGSIRDAHRSVKLTVREIVELRGRGGGQHLAWLKGFRLVKHERCQPFALNVKSVFKIELGERGATLRFVSTAEAFQGFDHKAIAIGGASSKPVDPLAAVGKVTIEEVNPDIVHGLINKLKGEKKTDEHPTVKAMKAAGRKVSDDMAGREGPINSVLEKEVKPALLEALDVEIEKREKLLGDLPTLRVFLGLTTSDDMRSTHRNISNRRDAPKEGKDSPAEFIAEKTKIPFTWSLFGRYFRAGLLAKIAQAEESHDLAVKIVVLEKEVEVNAEDMLGWPDWTKEGIAARLEAIEKGDVRGAVWVVNQALRQHKVEIDLGKEGHLDIVKAAVKTVADAVIAKITPAAS